MSPEYKDKLDLYKLTVEMADRVSARRAMANTFFLSINTVLTSLLAFVKDWTNGLRLVNYASATLVAGCVGIIISSAWFFALRSYRRLNAAKYKVIQALENDLHAKPFTDEWAELKKSAPSVEGQISKWQRWWVDHKDQYTELTDIESVVPIIFGLIYLGLII